MELKDAIQLFEEIVELIYETENPRLIEVIEGIYTEATTAADTAALEESCLELVIAINEEEFEEEEEDAVNEIQEKIELMSE